MFLDASAVIAIIAQEEEWELLAEPLANAAAIYVSPLSIWESVMGLSRARDWSFDESEELVRDLIGELGAEIVAIDDQIGREALRAAKIYGRGRHRAALNFGDCFAYACAKACAVSLLFKGDDFSETDIPSATPAPPRR